MSSSFYEDASLVLIPSGYKTSKVYCAKPTDGAADLSFTRSNDTATRVNSAGLIEKVRTNLVLQSNTFNTTWTTTDVTLTSGQAGYDATNNAWSIVEGTVNTQHRIVQAVSGLSSGTPYTFSFYVKAIGNRNCRLRVIGTATTHDIFFNLQNGTIQTSTAGTGVISSVGGGWYRCSVAANIDLSTVSVYLNIVDASFNNVYVGDNTSGLLAQSAQLETGDIATDYIATTSAAVSVGPVANVPRLDYLNSSCPRLLLEPQRTNLALYSEQFDNAAWVATSTTVTANTTISPDGYQNADSVFADATNGAHFLRQGGISVTSGTTYTASVFVKKLGYRYFRITLTVSVPTTVAVFDFDNGTATGASGIEVKNYGNGWYRLSVPVTANATGGTRFNLELLNDNGDTSFAGDGTKGILVYGAQYEAGAYATSYIPTLGAAVTRGADAASKTGISSLIGQTEGVLFVDFVYNNTPTSGTAQWLFFLGSSNTYIGIFISIAGKIRANVVNVTDQAVIDTSYNLVAGTRYKAALAYKANDFSFYVNGVQIGVDTSGTVPAVSSLQNNYNTTAANSSNAGLNQALLFKTRLSNDALQALTTL